MRKGAVNAVQYKDVMGNYRERLFKVSRYIYLEREREKKQQNNEQVDYVGGGGDPPLSVSLSLTCVWFNMGEFEN